MVSRIVEKVEQMNNAFPARTVVLQLDPPELGSIELTVRARGHRVEASIVTEAEWVRHAIEANRSLLTGQLSDRGLSLEGFDVSTQAHANDGRDQQQAAGRARQGGEGSAARESQTLEFGPIASVSLHSRMMDIQA